MEYWASVGLRPTRVAVGYCHGLHMVSAPGPGPLVGQGQRAGGLVVAEGLGRVVVQQPLVLEVEASPAPHYSGHVSKNPRGRC